MSTTVHLAADLLESVDNRARELGLSRNRYIIRALELALVNEKSWSPHFVEALEKAGADHESRQALDEMRRVLAANRTRKPAPTL